MEMDSSMFDGEGQLNLEELAIVKTMYGDVDVILNLSISISISISQPHPSSPGSTRSPFSLFLDLFSLIYPAFLSPIPPTPRSTLEPILVGR